MKPSQACCRVCQSSSGFFGIVRPGVMSTNARHQFFVQFANHANTNRKFLEQGDSMFQSDDVIADFAQIFGLRSTATPASDASNSPSVA